MSQELERQQEIGRLILIYGFSILMVLLAIVFVMVVYAMKRKANKETVVQDFLKENRSNGKHVEHGTTDKH